MSQETLLRVAFWILFGGMLVMQIYFASRMRQAGERVRADRQAPPEIDGSWTTLAARAHAHTLRPSPPA